ncbi:restriction endonuclease subunit S [Bombiscardovia apis]|uniref:Restriction endonuclease subunit S n=1 Tax=Bombiscardovia apis TaxID=2932182 RepID=A0ABM8BDN2_9BIFI|nr:restriction endonuclease subunit S [Bombiscardovia apis]BDR55021.1 restriction endonuclease subunit S [Bombiscardovia apis]
MRKDNNQKLVPQLRFKGFTDPWEQYKLKDITVRVTRKVEERTNINPLTISAQYGLVDQSAYFDRRVASSTLSGYFLINNGEFAYNKSTSKDYPYGAIKRLDKYENGALSTLYIVFSAEKSLSLGLVYYFESRSWHKQIDLIAAEGARNHGLLNIAPKDFFSTQIMLPSNRTEWHAIGAIFEILDNLIAAHERKCELLKKKKTYYLQQIFSQKFRFKGFTQPWQQRKLGELEENGYLSLHRGNVISERDIQNAPGSYPIYSASASSNGLMGQYSKYMFDEELITWSIDGGGEVFYRPRHKFSVTNVCGYIRIKSEFAYSFLSTELSYLHKGIHFDYTTKAHPSVIRNLYFVRYPALKEQEYVGVFFSSIDELERLLSQRIELLKQLKKAYLQKMFI